MIKENTFPLLNLSGSNSSLPTAIHKAVAHPLEGGGYSCGVYEQWSAATGGLGLGQVHSTHGMAASWALFRGISVQAIYSTVSRSLLLTFIRFYMLDASAPCVASAVLVLVLESSLTGPCSISRLAIQELPYPSARHQVNIFLLGCEKRFAY